MAEMYMFCFGFWFLYFFFLKVNVVTDMPMKGRVDSKGTMQLGSSLALADSLHAFIYFNLLPQSLSTEVSYLSSVCRGQPCGQNTEQLHLPSITFISSLSLAMFCVTVFSPLATLNQEKRLIVLSLRKP